MIFARLAEVTRGDWEESWHDGWAVLVDAEGRVLEAHGEPGTVFVRSALKPFQAIPLVKSGAAARLGLSVAELAIACSSHSATPEQVALARSILDKAGVSPDMLRCGAHPPLHEPTAEAMLCRGEAPTALHNNCSGKHAAMLAMCKDQGWDLETYDRLDHPLQVAIRHAIADLTGLAPESLTAGIDGCGVPAWRLPLTSLAIAFSRLVRDPALVPIAEAMATHPGLVAGPGRFDTLLMEAVGDRLVAKAGAEAIHAGADRTTGLAWAVKIADGNRRAIPPVVVAMLAKRGVLDATAEAIAPLALVAVKNRRGETVGSIRAAIPAR
ncbi:asparaginase [bacterium]|nr:asparaginase [bacterium]